MIKYTVEVKNKDYDDVVVIAKNIDEDEAYLLSYHIKYYNKCNVFVIKDNIEENVE